MTDGWWSLVSHGPHTPPCRAGLESGSIGRLPGGTMDLRYASILDFRAFTSPGCVAATLWNSQGSLGMWNKHGAISGWQFVSASNGLVPHLTSMGWPAVTVSLSGLPDKEFRMVSDSASGGMYQESYFPCDRSPSISLYSPILMDAKFRTGSMLCRISLLTGEPLVDSISQRLYPSGWFSLLISPPAAWYNVGSQSVMCSIFCWTYPDEASSEL